MLRTVEKLTSSKHVDRSCHWDYHVSGEGREATVGFLAGRFRLVGQGLHRLNKDPNSFQEPICLICDDVAA